jgi:hypothetical protein
MESTVPVWEEANGQARKAPRARGQGEVQVEGCLMLNTIGCLTNHGTDIAVSNMAKAGYVDVMQGQGFACDAL